MFTSPMRSWRRSSSSARPVPFSAGRRITGFAEARVGAGRTSAPRTQACARDERRSRVRSFPSDAIAGLADAFARRAANYDREGGMPVESLAAAAQAGLFALTVPRELGGRGAGLGEASAIARPLGRSRSCRRHFILAMTWLQHATPRASAAGRKHSTSRSCAPPSREGA